MNLSRRHGPRSPWNVAFGALAVIAMALAVSTAQAARQLSISQNIRTGSTLAGQLAWTAAVSGPKSGRSTVTFSIDGAVAGTDATGPYELQLDTTRLANGPHTFAVSASGPGSASSSATATVQNGATPTPFTVSQAVGSGGALSGTVAWTASASGVPSTDVTRVDFLVDGAVVLSDTSGPFGDAPGFFDTRKVGDGSHTFAARATARDGRTATASKTATVSNAVAPPPAPQPSFPITAAFYYPWYPETWTVGGAHVFYRPTLGYYSSTDTAAQQAHVRALQYAGMEAAIASWWPPGHYSTSRIQSLMQTTLGMGSPLKWAIYYEPEGYGNPTVDTIASHLAYIRDNLANSSAYLKVNGKFVVFVWTDGSDSSCSLADRWRDANARLGGAAYISLKVFYGYPNCASQPNAWHQYGIVLDEQRGQSVTISPGFWRADESSPRVARDPARWQRDVSAFKSSTAPWKLVVSFNEWGEGTSTESAQEWASASGYGTYLDALHNALGSATASTTSATATRNVRDG